MPYFHNCNCNNVLSVHFSAQSSLLAICIFLRVYNYLNPDYLGRY